MLGALSWWLGGLSCQGSDREGIPGGQAEEKMTSSVKGRAWATPRREPAGLTRPPPATRAAGGLSVRGHGRPLQRPARPGHRQQQAPCQSRPPAPALHFPGRAALRGGAWEKACVPAGVCPRAQPPSPVLWAPLLRRAASVRKRQSASASRCSTWTAGPGAGCTPPSRTCWGRACTTTSRWGGRRGGVPAQVPQTGLGSLSPPPPEQRAPP